MQHTTKFSSPYSAVRAPRGEVRFHFQLNKYYESDLGSYSRPKYLLKIFCGS
ncbi:Protein of unknown function [Pyronema omphalodes CBS 100304]|uniref:Uncharacterized protein n=1 Tax=Pyronema omphalodes (strain CBS 100304) TaxID=1076935 RepID=U4L9E1_PYROM|nr:Protein of unknown function [Pyronema omphalodes CBS 100304]